MKVLGSAATLGLLFLLFRAAIVIDVAVGYADCQNAMLAMAQPYPTRSYQEDQALQHQAGVACHVASVKAKLGQAALAPTTLRD